MHRARGLRAHHSHDGKETDLQLEIAGKFYPCLNAPWGLVWILSYLQRHEAKSAKARVIILCNRCISGRKLKFLGSTAETGSKFRCSLARTATNVSRTALTVEGM
jgi:hypothetical protein